MQNVSTISTPTGNVGYMQFNDHLPTAEQQLIDAFAQLAVQNVTDLVLDLRYNGGGLLAIASEVAYMIAGTVPTAGQTFERLRFNDKHTAINPVTGGAADADAVLRRVELRATAADAEPAARLRAHGRDDVLGQRVDHQRAARRQRGSDPDRLDDVRQAVRLLSAGQLRHDVLHDPDQRRQRRWVSATTATASRRTTSPAPAACVCRAARCADDFTRPLGDPVEARFAAALEFRRSQTCPAPTGISGPGSTKPFDRRFRVDGPTASCASRRGS